MSVERIRIERLSSGRVCHVYTPAAHWWPGYRVLYFPEFQGDSNAADDEEMMAIALRHARIAAMNVTGDAENYTIVNNGAASRRACGFHCHLFPVRGKIGKTVLYSVLFFKNMTHPLWRLLRPLRRMGRAGRTAKAGTGI